MANRHNTTREFLLAALVALLFAPDILIAQPPGVKGPTGGITFNPPRSAKLRLNSGQFIRGELIFVSRELVRFRLQGGKRVDYDFDDVRYLGTKDGGIKYTSTDNSYQDIVEEARGLAGVRIHERAVAAANGEPPELPRPPAPPIPVMLDSPEQHHPASIAAAPSHETSHQAQAVPPIPPATAPAAQAGAMEPFYETSAFKIGFLVACLAVVGLWWRNKVG